jgi:hypothetical protein
MKSKLIVAAALAAVGVPQSLAATIDGTVDAAYGPALAVQTVGTQFGNSTDPAQYVANGSELNAAYASISGGMLNIMLAGNLETNFNKLEVYIDAAPGGQNQLRSDNPDVDFNGLNRQAGLIFDAGFAPDYWVTYTSGNAGNPEHYLSSAQLLTDGGGAGGFVGGGAIADTPVISSGGPAVGGTLMAALDNSNTLGVGPFGDPFDSDPATVATGMELALDLNEIGWDGSSLIKIAAFINGGGHDFVSNQVLGALPAGTGNIGDPANVDFNQYEGAQYFVIPEPTSVLLLTIGGLLLRRR